MIAYPIGIPKAYPIYYYSSTVVRKQPTPNNSLTNVKLG
jgi:hypothetical protein